MYGEPAVGWSTETETQEMVKAKEMAPRLVPVEDRPNRPGVDILYEQVKGLEQTVDRLRTQLQRREQEAVWHLEELQRLRDRRPPEAGPPEQCCGNVMTCMKEDCVPRLQHQEKFWREEAQRLEAREKQDREDALKMHRLRSALLECLRAVGEGDKA